MEALLCISTILAIPLFMVMSRMHGGGWPKLPWGLDAWVIAAALTAPVYFLLHLSPTLGASLSLFGYEVHAVGFLTFFTYFLAFLGLRLGHGQYMKIPYSPRRTTAEKVDFLLLPFFGKDPRTRIPNFKDSGEHVHSEILEYGHSKLMYRNIAGLAITGTVVTLGASVALWTAGYPALSLVALAAGALKAYGYLEGDTEIGEYLRGFYLGIFSMSCLLSIINLAL